MPYFCAKLLSVGLFTPRKPRRTNTYDTSFVVICATNYANAFKVALVLGKEREVWYKGAKKGQTVRWAFVEVEEIKKLPRKLHGAEVGSVLDSLRTKSAVAYKKRFHPERHKPFLC
jgi:Domain of unknown function (DUF4288)